MPLDIQLDEDRRRLFLGFRTADEAAAADARRRGFKVYARRDNSFVCSAPEVSLFDLSNVVLPFAFDEADVWRIWTSLERGADDLAARASSEVGCSVGVFKGPYRDCQYRLACSDRAQVDRAVWCVLRDASGRPGEPGAWRGPGLRTNAALSECTEQTRRFLALAQLAYQRVCVRGSEHRFELYRPNGAVRHSVWRDLVALVEGGAVVFNLHDGVPFALGFSESTESAELQIVLVEAHLGGDPYGDCRPAEAVIEDWRFPREGKPVRAVVDRSLSGRTMQRLKTRFEGATAVALCPKSLQAVKTADWIVFNGCLCQASVASGDDWYAALARDTIRSWNGET